MTEQDPSTGYLPGSVTAIHIDPQFLFAVGAAIGDLAVAILGKFQITQSQGQISLSQLAQGAVVGQQDRIFLAPGIRAAVEGIFAAFHAGFVAIVQAGATGQGVLQKGCHQQSPAGDFVLLLCQFPFRQFLTSAVPLVYQGGEDTGGIVGA